MNYNTHSAIFVTVAALVVLVQDQKNPPNCNSCQEQLLQLREFVTNTENYIKPLNKDCDITISPKPIETKQLRSTISKQKNLIPNDYKKVFWTLLSDQEKFNTVIEKLIERIDKLDTQKAENEFWNSLTQEEAEEFLYYEEVMLLSH